MLDFTYKWQMLWNKTAIEKFWNTVTSSQACIYFSGRSVLRQIVLQICLVKYYTSIKPILAFFACILQNLKKKRTETISMT